MNDLIFQVIIAFIGGLISLVLFGVGFQIKQMNTKTESVVKSMIEVDKGLSLLINNNKYTEENVKKNEKSIDKIEDEISDIRKRVHDLGGVINGITYRLKMSCDKLNNIDFNTKDDA